MPKALESPLQGEHGTRGVVRMREIDQARPLVHGLLEFIPVRLPIPVRAQVKGIDLCAQAAGHAPELEVIGNLQSHFIAWLELAECDQVVGFRRAVGDLSDLHRALPLAKRVLQFAQFLALRARIHEQERRAPQDLRVQFLFARPVGAHRCGTLVGECSGIVKQSHRRTRFRGSKQDHSVSHFLAAGQVVWKRGCQLQSEILPPFR